MIANKNILIISPDAWGEYYLSKHHYAIELAKQNQVFFVNYANHKKPANAFAIQKHEDIPNLHIIDYRSSYKGLRLYPSFVREKIYNQQAKEIQKLIPKIDILWSFDAFRFPDLKVFDAKLHIYHPVDLYHSNLEENIADSADIIFASSELIVKKLSHLDTSAYKINHGLSEAFAQEGNSQNIDNKLLGNQRVKVALVGNITQLHLSQETLWRVVEDNPTVDFYFIGPKRGLETMNTTKKSYFDKIQAAKNTYYIPSQPYDKIKDYLAAMDILLICYDRESSEEAPPNPHKLLEYLSSGKTIVSNYFEDYKNETDLINMASSLAEYPNVFKDVIQNLSTYNGSEMSKQRRDFAEQHTYQNQLNHISEKLSSHNLL